MVRLMCSPSMLQSSTDSFSCLLKKRRASRHDFGLSHQRTGRRRAYEWPSITNSSKLNLFVTIRRFCSSMADECCKRKVAGLIPTASFW